MIFISYRRNDEPGYVGRLADGLRENFGDQQVFVDIDNLAVGQGWQPQIETKIKDSSVVLAIIGRRWESELQKRHTADGPITDVHQFELNFARSLSIPVVPILLTDTRLPDKTSLGELGWLTDEQVFTIRDGQNQWAGDVEKLVTGITSVTDLERKRIPTIGKNRRTVLAGLGLLMLVFTGLVLTRLNDNGAESSAGDFASDFPLPLGQLAHDWADTGDFVIMLDESVGSTEAHFLNNLKFPAGRGKQSELMEQFCNNNSVCIECTASPSDKKIQEAELVTIRFTGEQPPVEEEMLTADNTNSWPIKDEYLPWENIDSTTGKRSLFKCVGD